ncbi:MAG TPA: FtsH protease activity modulator HflK [Geminicoccaceae bacterium]|nr:FtsH protease activity modulator HflK [Geminicoccaceae bacterium]
MPWNSQGGGGWQGGGGPGPWGGRPGGGQQPPDLEELLRRSQEKVKNLFPGGGLPGGGRRGIVLAGLVVVGLWLASGIYTVQPDEQGLVTRFGELDRVTSPGLKYHLPAPIEAVEKVPVTRVNRIEVGFRSPQGTGVRTTGGTRDVSDEALMLTGDENIIDINFVVLWRIGSAADYRFNVRDPETTVKAAAESVMREIIGQTPIVEATTEGRRAIEQRAGEQLQALMNEYGTGILIDEVQLQKADPPAEVIDSFRDVQRAQADRERAQNEAEAFANDIIPRARGEAERLLQEAQAYRQEVTARATGEAERFKSILAEYVKAEDVTRRRLYLETMEQVLKGMNKVIIDGQQGANGVVPYLPLPELERRAREQRPQDGTVQGVAQ